MISRAQSSAAGGFATQTVSGISKLRQYNPLDYGITLDGTTDNTTKLLALFATVLNGGGGEIFIPPTGVLMCAGALAVPYTGGPSTPVQKPLRICGVGGNRTARRVGLINGGSSLDLRYNGGGAAVAKIDTRGDGFLEIDHLNLISGGSDNFLFMQNTNTVISVHDNMIVGNQANSGFSCVQDFLYLGASTNSPGSGDASNSGFQGYGSTAFRNTYDNIRSCITWGNDANGIEVYDDLINGTCGSSDTLSAPYQFNPLHFTSSVGNIIRGSVVELSYYKYIAALQGYSMLNFFDFVGGYDPGAATTAGFYLDAPASNNTVLMSVLDGHAALAGPGASATALIDPRNGALSTGALNVTGRANFTGGYDQTSAVAGVWVGGIAEQGTPRIMFADGTAARNWQLDNNAGALRFIQPGVVRMSLAANGNLTLGGVLYPVQAATASAPAYVKGGVYFDTTLNKLRVGGASAWETVTSS